MFCNFNLAAPDAQWFALELLKNNMKCHIRANLQLMCFLFRVSNFTDTAFLRIVSTLQ